MDAATSTTPSSESFYPFELRLVLPTARKFAKRVLEEEVVRHIETPALKALTDRVLELLGEQRLNVLQLTAVSNKLSALLADVPASSERRAAELFAVVAHQLACWAGIDKPRLPYEMLMSQELAAALFAGVVETAVLKAVAGRAPSLADLVRDSARGRLAHILFDMVSPR